MKLYENVDWLYENYVEKGLTSRQMAKIAGCDKITILKHLKKANIKRREGCKAPNHITFSEELSEILSGEMLGDGNISTNGVTVRSARYRHGSKYPEYLAWLFGLLSEYGLHWNEKIDKRITNFGTGFSAQTYSYRELIEWYNTWYPNGIKIVPQDFKLTPTTLRHFFIGDGSFGPAGRCIYGMVSFATCGFPLEDVKYLQRNFLQLGMDARINARHYIFFGKASSVEHFFDYIGPCPEGIKDIYGYKWAGGGKR